jgi:hypothetical protein
MAVLETRRLLPALIASIVTVVIWLGAAASTSLVEVHGGHDVQWLIDKSNADPAAAQLVRADASRAQQAPDSFARLLHAFLLTFVAHRAFRSEPLREARLRAIARRSS